MTSVRRDLDIAVEDSYPGLPNRLCTRDKPHPVLELVRLFPVWFPPPRPTESSFRKPQRRSCPSCAARRTNSRRDAHQTAKNATSPHMADPSTTYAAHLFSGQSRACPKRKHACRCLLSCMMAPQLKSNLLCSTQADVACALGRYRRSSRGTLSP